MTPPLADWKTSMACYATFAQIVRGKGRKLVIFATLLCTFPTFFCLTHLILSQVNSKCLLFYENTSRELSIVLNYNIKTRRTLILVGN